MRVVPELREDDREFRRLNFVEDFGMSEMADAIFCRNVIIYFDPANARASPAEVGVMPIGGEVGTCSLATRKPCTVWTYHLVPVGPALYRKINDRDRS